MGYSMFMLEVIIMDEVPEAALHIIFISFWLPRVLNGCYLRKGDKAALVSVGYCGV